jgi:hypothetical protein
MSGVVESIDRSIGKAFVTKELGLSMALNERPNRRRRRKGKYLEKMSEPGCG